MLSVCLKETHTKNSYAKNTWAKSKEFFFVHFAAASRNGIANGAMRCPCANSRGSLGPIKVDPFFLFCFIVFFLPFCDWKPYFARPTMRC